MPISSNYDPDKGILFCSVEGYLSNKEFYASLGRLAKSNDYPPDVNTLWDLRKMSFRAINSESMRAPVERVMNTPERGKAKIAMLVDSDLGFGVSRMWESMRAESGQQTMVFRDYAEAERWLSDQ